MGNEYKRIECPICREVFAQEKKHAAHLKDRHGVVDLESLYVDTFLSGVRPTCTCSDGCPSPLRWYGWKKGYTSRYARGHNARVDSCWHDKEHQQRMARTRVEGYASGKYKVWNAGLTKETSEKVRVLGERTSASLREGYESGKYVPWQRGLTKETPESIEHAAAVKDPEVLKKNHGRPRPVSVCTVDLSRESLGRIEMYDFVKSLAPDAILSDKTVLVGKELDVYVPARAFAIEYDGLYDHSVTCQHDNGYHDEKTTTCAANGVRLLHVFEDEWRDKREIVESVIVNALGLNERKVHARKCTVRKLSTDERRAFFDSTHLDGDCRSEIAWGLEHRGELVAALSLRRPFHASTYADAREVGRFSCARRTTVVGGLSRLIRVAQAYCTQMHVRRMITYVDTRVGTGAGYIKAGFVDKGYTARRFWWTDHVNRFNRFSVRADKKNGITQRQAALDAGVVSIWGCRNRIFELGCDVA